MKPLNVVERAAFHVIGVRERFVPGKIERIPLLWDQFIRRADEIANQVPCVHYGVCIDDREGPTSAPGFFYIAGVGVTSLDVMPAGMAGFTVPAGTYAVFTHKGPIADLHQTIAAIWREWLPASGLTTTGAPDFELYDERFKMQSPDSEVDVYVPVVPPR